MEEAKKGKRRVRLTLLYHFYSFQTVDFFERFTRETNIAAHVREV